MMAPRPRCTTSPGTRAVTSTSRAVPSRRTTARWVTRECKASEARSARNSLVNPRPTLTSRITPITIEFVASPRKSDSPAVMSSRIRMGLANCRPSTSQPLARWVRTAFGPSSARRAADTVSDSPAGLETSCLRTCSASRPAASATDSCRKLRSPTLTWAMPNPFVRRVRNGRATGPEYDAIAGTWRHRRLAVAGPAPHTDHTMVRTIPGSDKMVPTSARKRPACAPSTTR